MRARQVLFGALFALGCSDATAPGTLAGTWRQDFDIPGNGLEFTLTMNSNDIVGTGHWSGEACCSGVVAVTGNATGGDVSLSVAYTTDRGAPVPPRTSRFAGRFTDANTLAGDFVAENNASQPTVFRRQR